ncbi:MAG: Crp/Fnr family transcriptional regulator [Christensenellales bacterium]
MNQDYRDTLKTYLTFWNNLSLDEQNLILQNVSSVRTKKGSTIHGGDSNCVGLLLLKSGVLRVYMLSEEGREITLYQLYEGDTCILSASCILNQITFDVHIDAETDCEILLISAHVISSLIKSNVYVENFSYKLAADRFSDVMWAMQQILFMGFDKRLAVYLLDESTKTGSTTIKSTHEQIAKQLGSAREVVTRMLKHFQDSHLVEVSRGETKITDKNKLKELIS